MPVYTYYCPTCGGFEARRSLVQFADPAPCPICSEPAPRALTIPHMAATLQATAERAAGKPSATHTAGCSCCAPRRFSHRA